MKVHAITMGYAPARVLKAGVDRFYATRNKDLKLTHYIVDHLYPLRHGEVRAEIESLAVKYGAEVLTPTRNLGLHKGLNWACEQIRPSPGDIILDYDPDSWPNDFGWDMAIAAGMSVGKFDVLGLGEPRALEEMLVRGVKARHLVDGYLKILEPVREGIISVAGYSWDFLKACGGFDQVLPLYGGLEASMWAHLKVYGGRWGYLPQYGESQHLTGLHDDEYREWKWAHAQTRNFPGSFESWLEQGLRLAEFLKPL